MSTHSLIGPDRLIGLVGVFVLLFVSIHSRGGGSNHFVEYEHHSGRQYKECLNMNMGDQAVLIYPSKAACAYFSFTLLGDKLLRV